MKTETEIPFSVLAGKCNGSADTLIATEMLANTKKFHLNQNSLQASQEFGCLVFAFDQQLWPSAGRWAMGDGPGWEKLGQEIPKNYWQ